MEKLSAFIFLFLLIANEAVAQATIPPVNSIVANCATGNVLGVGTSGLACSSPSSAVLSGTYTVATLPAASSNQAKYAFVTDLGGGADMVISDGTYWKHIRPGVLTNVAAASAITVTPLQSPTQMLATGSGLLSTGGVNIVTTNLYPGYAVHIVIPSGVLSATASLGVSVGSGTPLPLAGGTWADYQWNGTTLIKTAGGTL